MDMSDRMIEVFAKSKFKYYQKLGKIKIESNDPQKKVAVLAFNIGDFFGRVCIQNKFYEKFATALMESDNNAKKEEIQ